jgi:hypothetical protein
MNELHSSAEWLQRLRALHGEFRPPPRYLLLVQLLAALIIGMGAFILFKAWQRYQYTHALGSLIFGAAFGGSAVAVGYYQQRRAACGYRFEGGRICFISGVGRVLWAEDLATLERVEVGRLRADGPDYLLLHWLGRSRRIDLLGSMKAALAASAL